MNSQSLPAGTLSVDPTDGEAAQMKEHDITYDGIHYFFSGYRYSKLGDALNYAKLVRERPELPSRGHTVAASDRTGLSTDAAGELMTVLGIDLEAGTFRFGGFRYDRLEDAVAYAKLTSKRQGPTREAP